jgi:isohexenylglutaconyl-CoA hydratase
MPASLPPSETLRLERAGPLLRLTLNRPEQRNAMSFAMVAELEAVFDGLRGDRATRVVVLRGAGGNFCAGGDIRDMAAAGQTPPGPGAPDPMRAGNRAFGRMLAKANALPQAVIAVLEGAVMGGGLGLACIADIAIAHADATFAMPETGLGLVPAQIAPFVVARIGLTNARRLGVSGLRCKAEEARALGLVHLVAADDDALAPLLKQSVEQVLRCAPAAVAATKELMLAVGEEPLDLLLDRAADAFAAAVRGAEGREGTSAFVQKRKAAWVETVD